MKQYEFQMINKYTGRVEHARATALHAAIARAQIALAYADSFYILDTYSDINPAHHVAGEIDCSDNTLADIPWLESQANALEGY